MRKMLAITAALALYAALMVLLIIYAINAVDGCKHDGKVAVRGAIGYVCMRP